MTLLQLQDVTYRYKNTAEAVLYQIKYTTVIRTLLKQFYIRSSIILNPENFIVSLVSQEQGNPLSCPSLLV